MIFLVEKRGGDAKTEGKRACIGGGTVTRSVYRKKRLGAAKKPPMYLHKQTAGGAHRVGCPTENVWKMSTFLYILVHSVS